MLNRTHEQKILHVRQTSIWMCGPLGPSPPKNGNARTAPAAVLTRMWANAQHDGRPTEYRWRPLLNAEKFGWCPLLECRAVTLPRHETRWNLQGCPNSGTISAINGPKFTILWEHVEEVLVLNKFFFRLSIYALVAKIQPDEVVQWCQDGDFLRRFCVLYFQRAACSTFQTCILNSH